MLALLALRTRHFEFSSGKPPSSGLRRAANPGPPFALTWGLETPVPQTAGSTSALLRSRSTARPRRRPPSPLRPCGFSKHRSWFSNSQLTWGPEASQDHVQNDLILSFPDSLSPTNTSNVFETSPALPPSSLPPRSIARLLGSFASPAGPDHHRPPPGRCTRRRPRACPRPPEAQPGSALEHLPSPARVEDACVLTSVMLLHSLPLHRADKQRVTRSA